MDLSEPTQCVDRRTAAAIGRKWRRKNATLRVGTQLSRDGETLQTIRVVTVAVRRHFGVAVIPEWTHGEFYTETATSLTDLR